MAHAAAVVASPPLAPPRCWTWPYFAPPARLGSRVLRNPPACRSRAQKRQPRRAAARAVPAARRTRAKGLSRQQTRWRGGLGGYVSRTSSRRSATIDEGRIKEKLRLSRNNNMCGQRAQRNVPWREMGLATFTQVRWRIGVGAEGRTVNLTIMCDIYDNSKIVNHHGRACECDIFWQRH